jgi:hypothetical protein
MIEQVGVPTVGPEAVFEKLRYPQENGLGSRAPFEETSDNLDVAFLA